MESCSYTIGHFRFSNRFVFCFSCLFVNSRLLIEWYRQTKESKYLSCLKSLINTSQQRAEPNCHKSDLICLANEGISRNSFRADKISENYLIIVIIPSFTLDSIYSINASGAEEMPETNNSNQDGYYKRGRGFEVWTKLNNSVPWRDLNSGVRVTSPAL